MAYHDTALSCHDVARARSPLRRFAAPTIAVAIAVAIAVLAALTGATTAGAALRHGDCRGANTSAGGSPPARIRAALVCLVNRQRTSRGLPPLRELRRLDGSAQSWSNAMVASDSFSHTGGASDPGSRIAAHGYRWSAVGENIATGFATPRQVLVAWMASPDHCHNILDPQFTDVGSGIVPRPVGGGGSGRGTWTLDFGRPRGERPPSGNWRPAHGCPY
jgi:uncharacterized protein YkwD